MNIREELEQKGYTLDKLRLDNAVFNEQNNTLDLLFSYAEWNVLTDEQKEEITNICKNAFQNEAQVSVKFKGAYIDNEILFQMFQKFLEEHYKALLSVLTTDKVNFEKQDRKYIITLTCDNITAEMIKSGTFSNELVKFMTNECFYDFEVLLISQENCDISVLNQTSKVVGQTLGWALEQERNLNKLEIGHVEYLFGKVIEEKPDFIINAKKSDADNIVICGVVSQFEEGVYKKKFKDPNAEPVEATKFSFFLTDASDEIRIVVFPSEKDVEKLRTIHDGQEIVLSGGISSYNDNISVRARSISTCELLQNEIHYCYRGVNEEYAIVKPQPWVEVSQIDLFSFAESNVSDYLKNNTIVMFDLETTGLDPERCTITEIGAIKIKNGKCVESFQTLVNPQTPIPDEVMEKTHITNEMVADAPTIEQVMPDFYKFVDGSILSAYNIGFDYMFLKNIGQRLRYKFDNERIDCLDVVRQKVPSLSNYKLATVSKALNVELKNAHRALADALAAAKVFIKLM